jgi:hypothetical protein
MYSAILFYVAFLTAQLLNGFRKYLAELAMPLVSTCSAAISANCHRPDPDKEAHLLPVQWGVTEEELDGIERCSFTTLRTVQPPKPGNFYLGMAEIRNEKSMPRVSPWLWVRRLFRK